MQKIIKIKPAVGYTGGLANGEFAVEDEAYQDSPDHHQYKIIPHNDGKHYWVYATDCDLVGERFVEVAPFVKLGLQKIRSPHDRDIDNIIMNSCRHIDLMRAILNTLTTEQLSAIKIDLMRNPKPRVGNHF